VVKQAAAVERVRVAMRDLRSGGESRGVARERLPGFEIAGPGGEADRVGQEVLDLIEFFRVAGEPGGQYGQGGR
jgi:hypothetical protein